MKKLLLASLLLVMLISSSAFAITSEVTVDPLGFVWGVANIEYSSAISDSSAWAIRLDYAPFGWGLTGIGGGASYRGYFSPTALAGFYWGVGVDLMSISGSYSVWLVKVAYSGFFVTPKVELGYNFVIGSNFVLGLDGFLGYMIGSLGASVNGVSVTGYSIPFSGFAYGLGVKVGYGW